MMRGNPVNNSMLRVRDHVSAGFFHHVSVTSYSCKMNTVVFVILLQVRKSEFFNGSKC